MWPIRGLAVLRSDLRAPGRDARSVVDRVVFQAVAHHLANTRVQAPDPTLVVVGADDLGRAALEEMARNAYRARVRLVYLFEHLKRDAMDLLGGGDSVAVLMKMGNGDEARTAAEFVGHGFTFQVSQLSRQVGTNRDQRHEPQHHRVQRWLAHDGDEQVAVVGSRWRRVERGDERVGDGDLEHRLAARNELVGGALRQQGGDPPALPRVQRRADADPDVGGDGVPARRQRTTGPPGAHGRLLPRRRARPAGQSPAAFSRSLTPGRSTVVWHGFDLHRLTAVPRPPRDDRTDDPTPAQLFAALTATYAALSDVGREPAVVVGRLRPEGSPQISFFAGGRPWFPPATDGPGHADDDSETAILYPPGARGRRLPAAELDAMVESLPHWVACAGRPDSLWLPDDSRRGPRLRGSFDDYVAHLHGAFGWVVLAEPVPPEAVDEELASLGLRIPHMRKKESSEQARLDLERAEGRFRELSRSRVTGVWNVRLLVGGHTAATARSAAALLCSAGELEDTPYVVQPGRETLSFADALGKPVALPDGSRSPFPASSELLLALTRTPSRELPGIRLVAPPCFDVTPEVLGDGGIPLGEVLDEALRPAGPFRVPRATLNRHAFVVRRHRFGQVADRCGTLLEGLARDPDGPVPWLVIEPAKAEYAAHGRPPRRRRGGDRAQPGRPGRRHPHRSTRSNPSPASRCRATPTWCERCSSPPSRRTSRSRRCSRAR